MSRNKDNQPSQAKPLKGEQEPTNAISGQLSEDQLDKVTGGDLSIGGAAMAGAVGGAGAGAAGGAQGTSTGSTLLKGITDTINSVTTRIK
jgi:hypothetical protein